MKRLVDTRVGYMTVDIIVSSLEQYITAHTTRNEHGYIGYTGKPIYLEQYKMMVKYLEGG